MEDYVLGTSERELRRFDHQHLVWSASAFELWRAIDLRPGQCVLDLGCGLGFTTVDLARWVGSEGRVVGVDASERYVEHARARASALGLEQVEVHVGDVRALALGDASFDVVYSRWVLCYVDAPEQAAREAARVLAPGGTPALQEYFNQEAESVAPRDPLIDRVLAALVARGARAGATPTSRDACPVCTRLLGSTRSRSARASSWGGRDRPCGSGSRTSRCPT